MESNDYENVISFGQYNIIAGEQLRDTEKKSFIHRIAAEIINPCVVSKNVNAYFTDDHIYFNKVTYGKDSDGMPQNHNVNLYYFSTRERLEDLFKGSINNNGYSNFDSQVVRFITAYLKAVYFSDYLDQDLKGKPGANGYFQLANKLETVLFFGGKEITYLHDNADVPTNESVNENEQGMIKTCHIVPISEIKKVFEETCKNYPEFTRDLFLYYMDKRNFGSNQINKLRLFFGDEKFQELAKIARVLVAPSKIRTNQFNVSNINSLMNISLNSFKYK